MPPNARPIVLVLAAVIGLGAAVPCAATAAPQAPAVRSTDAFSELGGGSPSCAQDVGALGRRNCRATGSIAHQYPVGNYGLDVHVDFGISTPGNAFTSALQHLGAMLWMALVYVLNGVLLLVEWGFSIDLLGSAMSAVRHTLDVLHHDVIGQPWFLAALSVTAIWGIWRGLVQRHAASTITGLLATVGLMICGLAILARPDETVGHASRLANTASLGFLSAATAQPLAHPSRSLADASQGVFDSLVRDPWCALQFGSVTYCDHKPTGREDAPSLLTKAPTVADAWLSLEPGSQDRDLLYHALNGDALLGHSLGQREDPDRVEFQQAGGTFSRLAILGLVALGLLGAAALLAFLGIRLLLASVLTLLLLLFAPAMLLAPAFGESGRATFIAWAKRLLGALAAKLIYALFLAVVLTAAAMLRRLDVGWLGVWLLQIAFWWGVFIKRSDLIGFVSVQPQGDQHQRGLISALAQGYYAMQFARVASHAGGRMLRAPLRTTRSAAALPARVGRAAIGHVKDRRATSAGSELDEHGRGLLEAEQHRAHDALGERDQLRRELRAVDRSLSGYDETHAQRKAAGMAVPVPSSDQAALLRRRRELIERLASPEVTGAEAVVAHAQRNTAQTGQPVTTRDLAIYRAQRGADHAARLPLDHPRHLRAAGIDPQEFAAADDSHRVQLLNHVREHLDREQTLLARVPQPDTGPPELRVDPHATRRRRAARRKRRQELKAHVPRTPTQR